MNKIKRSLSVKLSIIIIGCIVLLSAGLIITSSVKLRNFYSQQIESISTIVHNNFIGSLDSIEQYATLAENLAKPYEDTAQGRQIQRYIESYTFDDKIKNIYLLYPDIIEDGDQEVLKVLAANYTMMEEGFLPNSFFPLSPEVKTALNEAQEKQFSLSQPYSDEFGSKMTSFTPLKDEKGNLLFYVGIDYDNSYIQSHLQREMTETSFISVAIGIVFIVISFFIIRYMLKPFTTISEISQQAAQGDLTVSLEVKSSDEAGQMAQNFNLMIDNLRLLIQQVKDLSVKVNSSSNALLQSAEENTTSARQVAASMEQLTEGANRQRLGAQDSSRAMEEMATGIQNIAESASQAAESSVTTLNKAEASNNELQKHSLKAQEIQKLVSESVATIQSMSQLSQEIGTITSTISEISAQTNILSLNAAIEAARAGEHGKGFSVVSSEIRALAEQSKQASDRIASIVQDIQVTTMKSVEVMQASSNDVGEMTKLFSNMKEVFEDIVSSIGVINTQMQEVSAVSEEMSASSEEVSASITELSTISSEASEASLSVSNVASQQLNSMQSITEAASALNEDAKALLETVEKFKISRSD